MGDSTAKRGGWAAAVAVVALLVVVYYLRYALLPFVFAAALAYVAQPLLNVLGRRWAVPHLVAVMLVFAVYVLMLGGLGYWAFHELTAQLSGLAGDTQATLHAMLARLLGGEEATVLGQRLQSGPMAEEAMRQLAAWAGSPVHAAQATALVIETVMGCFLMFVLLFYFMLHGPRLVDGAVWLVPPVRRAEIRGLLRRIDPLLRRYLVGLAVIFVATTLLAWVGIGPVMGMPHAGLLALLTGVLEMIPVVGPAAAAILVGLAAIEQGGIWTILGFVVYFSALRLLIDQVVGPLVLGKAATLHPVVVIFSFLAGGVLFGPLGVLVAVPVAASIKIILGVYYGELGQPAPAAADGRPSTVDV